RKSMMPTTIKKTRNIHNEAMRYHSLPLKSVICLNMVSLFYVYCDLLIARYGVFIIFDIRTQPLQVGNHGDNLTRCPYFQPLCSQISGDSSGLLYQVRVGSRDIFIGVGYAKNTHGIQL